MTLAITNLPAIIKPEQTTLKDNLTLINYLQRVKEKSPHVTGVEVSRSKIAGIVARRIAGTTAFHATEDLRTWDGRLIYAPKSFLDLIKTNASIFISKNAIDNPGLVSVLNKLPAFISTLNERLDAKNHNPLLQGNLIISAEVTHGKTTRYVIQNTNELIRSGTDSNQGPTPNSIAGKAQISVNEATAA